MITWRTVLEFVLLAGLIGAIVLGGLSLAPAPL